jgi:very-short-patch-repair endonuclease
VLNELSYKSAGENNGFWGKSHDEETKNKLAKTRENMAKFVSKPELIVWGMLQGLNAEFRYQIAIGRYIVDYIVGSTIIEVFGDYWHSEKVKMKHYSKPQKDVERCEYLRSIGYKVEVVWESEIFENPQNVVLRLKRILSENKIDQIDK